MSRKRKTSKRKKSNINNYYNFSEEELDKLFKKKKYKKTIEWIDEKEEVRKTKEWLELKCFCYHRQGGLDPLTGRKLPKTSNLHHCDLHDNNYGNFDSNNFVLLSQMSHKTFHYLFSCMHNRGFDEVVEELRYWFNIHEKLNHDIKTWKQAH